MKNLIKNFLLTLKCHTIDINIELFDFAISSVFNDTVKIDTKLLKKEYSCCYDKMLYACFAAFIEHVDRKYIASYKKYYTTDKKLSNIECLNQLVQDKTSILDKPYYQEIYTLYNWWVYCRPIRISIDDVPDYWHMKFKYDLSKYPFLCQDEKNKEIYFAAEENAEKKYIGKGIYAIEDSIMLSRLLELAEILY